MIGNDEVPRFDLDMYGPNPVQESIEFHERILEFIELNLNGQIDSTLLCHFTSEDDLMEAELPREAYKQALKASLEFFTEEEIYEQCNRIKELKEKL